ncbi:hypothetical protein [Nocardioides sp. GCM10027114]|uniref:hypothetical protein n=1 Tax=Nocardioides sp. GCM10027114 TaxID=3273406 RepID=UPI0036062CD3
MSTRRALAPAAVMGVLGALLGALTVWLSTPEPSPCHTLEDGLRACMPVVVIPPPPWLYGVAALAGAVLAAGATVALAMARHRWATSPEGGKVSPR